MFHLRLLFFLKIVFPPFCTLSIANIAFTQKVVHCETEFFLLTNRQTYVVAAQKDSFSYLEMFLLFREKRIYSFHPGAGLRQNYVKGIQLVTHGKQVQLNLQLMKNLLRSHNLVQALFDMQNWHFACFFGKTLSFEYREQATHVMLGSSAHMNRFWYPGVR